MRKLLLVFIIVFVSVFYIIRLAYLQLSNESAKLRIEDIAIRKIISYPERGYIYDRNNKLLVANQPSYDVMVIPNEVKEFDITEFCSLLNIKKDEYYKKLSKARRYSPRLPFVFVSQLSKKSYASLQEKMRKYKGFFIQKRSLRNYHTKSAANVLGYISEVNEWELKQKKEYNIGELIGRQGIEKQYENLLRGVKGIKYMQKDRFNRDVSPYKNGKYDILPKQGSEIQLSLDIDLQAYGEYLMNNKRGSIVAIEPKTGEILTLVSTPTYDPSLLVGRDRSKNYTELYRDSISKPMFNRGLQAFYPPGSPFKIINALIGLEEKVIHEKYTVICKEGYYYGKRGKKLKCHCRYGSKRNLNSGIYASCNAYFADTYIRILDKFQDVKKGIDKWSSHVKSFGFGNYLGYDLPIGNPGKVPNSKTYDRKYPQNKWFATQSISNAIGQGELLTTPIQLANLAAIIANRGYYYKPHLLKKINYKPQQNTKYITPFYTSIRKEHFEPVIKGMQNTYNKPMGTARYLKVPEINIAGKTGTAENYTKINNVVTQLTDHSIFMAFAPVENPKIALAVYVENGYWGSRWAGKIASLLIEKYLRGKITQKHLEKYVLKDEKILEEYVKPLSNKPFKINE